jgi:hypothetical protein
MKRCNLTIYLALAGMTVLGLADPVAAQVQVPLKGVLNGTYTVTPLASPFGYLVVSGAGQSLQFGQFTVSIPHTVNFALGTATGEYLFTAANGDKLVGTLSGVSTPVGTDGRFVTVVETVNFTGGSGRFVGAKGSLTCQRLVDRVNLTTAGTFVGTVIVRGS